MDPNWPAIIGVILGGVSLIVGGAMGYLTLFIDKKVNKVEKQILEHIDEKFAPRELMMEKFANHESRLTKVENRRR